MYPAAYQRVFLAVITFCLIWQAEASDEDVRLTSDGPVVLGGVITFKAELLDSDGNLKKQTSSNAYQYTWQDDAVHPHYYKTGTTTNTTTYFSVSYPFPTYHVGKYTMEVVVCKWGFLSIYCGEYTSRRINFHVTSLLNGNLTIQQTNKTVENSFVSSAETAKLSVDMRKSDLDYIAKTASSISTYWFIDCKFYNQTSDFKFNYSFADPLSFHIIEALVVANMDPPTTTTVIPPTTTSTTPSTTTVPTNGTTPTPSNATNTNTTTPSTTEPSTTAPSTTASTTTTSTSSTTVSASVNETAPLAANQTYPFICNSMIDPEPHKIYGYFNREVKIRAPISKLNIEGSTWIQPWNSLSLSVSCNGTGPFKKCIKIHTGKYNVTGNETCDANSDILDTCKFTFIHYFLDALEYTVVIILSNEVSTEIHPVLVNIYKLTPKAQLSVIVVPVSCSLVAVVLVVFGIAYYVQSRARFTVEVADFDFGQNSAEMEYKTFTERLRDSFNNAGYKQLNNTKELQ